MISSDYSLRSLFGRPLIIPLAWGAPGPEELVVIFLIGLGVFFVAKRRDAGQLRIPTLALRSFKVDPTSSAGYCIQIIGRPVGLVGYVLTLMGLNAETTLTVTDLQISIKSAGLSGEFNNFVPLPNVSSTHCGYSRPIFLIIAAAVVLLGGVLIAINAPDATPPLIVSFIIAILVAAVYFTGKKINIQLVTNGGLPLRLTFKPGIIEGVPVNIDFAVQALELLNKKVLQIA